MLTGGIHAMLTLPVEQVQYPYSADAIARAAQSAAESRIRPLRSMNWQKASTPTFFRANRQYIINVEHVLFLGNYFGGKLIVRLKGYPDTRITVSKEKAQRLKEWIDR